MNAETQKAKAIETAKAQVKAQNLAWVPGKGYALDYKAICAKAELRYGPAWRTVTAALMPTTERVAATQRDGTPFPRQVLAAKVATLRFKDERSWGYIAVQLNLGEGLVRTLFAEATGVMTQGLRIGYGGRHVAKNHDLYVGADRKEKGSEIKVGTDAHEAKPTVKRTLGQRVAAASKRKAAENATA